MTASTVDRLSVGLCAFAWACIVLSWVGCTPTQRRETRTALQAIDAACDALEVAQVDGTVTLACELTDDLRDEAIKALRSKAKKKRPRPAACSSAAPTASAAPASSGAP